MDDRVLGGQTLENHLANRLAEALAGSTADHAPRLLLLTGVDPTEDERLANELARIAGPQMTFAASVRRQALKPYTGLTELAEHLYGLVEAAGRPELADAHGYELSLMAPSLAGRISAKRPAPFEGYRPGETGRVAPYFWGRRCLHGLIDFLFAVQELLGTGPLAFGFHGLDEAGPEAQEFLILLCRRAARVQRPLLLWTTAAGDLPQAWVTTVERQQPGVAIERVSGTGERLAAPVRALDLLSCEVHEIMAATEHYARHGACADAAEYAQHLLLRIGPEHRELLPKALEVFRIAVNGVPSNSGMPDLLLLQELATTTKLRRRVELLTYLVMAQTRPGTEFDVRKADMYLEQAFSAADQASAPAERAVYRLIATHGLVLSYSRVRRFDEALLAGRMALADMESYWEPAVERARRSMVLYCMAQVAELAGDMEQALDLYQRCLEPDPDFPEYYQHLAASLNRVGRYAEALAFCDESLARTPPDWRVHTWRGQALAGLGRYPEAFREFDRAEELDPDGREIYLHRGLLRHELGETRGAVADYAAYLRLAPNDAEVLCNRGSARHDLGDREGALADLTAAVTQNPMLLAAWANRAAVLYDLGRLDEALQDLDRAILLEPGNEMLLQNRDALKVELVG